MPRTALDRAERLFAAGRDAELIALLEPQLPVYRESSRFYYILGSACLRSGDSGGASAYLKRAEQLDPSDMDTLLALAALAIRKGETDVAIASYLHVLDNRPGDAKAKKALELLRTEGAPGRIVAFARSGTMKSLYPGVPRAKRIALRLTAIALAGAALTGLAVAVIRLAGSMPFGKPARPDVEAISLSEREIAAPVSTSGTFAYALTESQAIASFEKAKAYFQEYRDNAALIEINRLLGSNASDAVKEKAKSLKAFVGAPDFRTTRDAPDFADVARDAGLYDGCSVIWKGMAANLRQKAGEEELRFDFLVGYQDKKRLEGIMPAWIARGPVPLDRPLEILAIVRSGGDKPSLECVAIHELLGSDLR